MRVLLFTGKGGVGKTTTAAATAVLAAQRGCKTLVLSTDPAHSLADAFGVQLGAEPRELDTGLAALQVDPQAAFERTWRELQGYLLAALRRVGVEELQAEELTVLPGAEEVLALLAVRDQVATGRWDLVVVDCAPTGETLRLLALPAALQWYVERVFPAHRRALRAVRPLLARSGGPTVPADAVFEAVERLHRELAEVHALLTAPSTSVRLVLTPEAVVVAETRRTLTSLALYGYRVDALVANRVFARDATDPFLAGWATAQAAQLEQVARDVAPLPVLVGPFLANEPLGLRDLADLGGVLYQGQDPVEGWSSGDPLVEVLRGAQGYQLRLALPLARAEELTLARTGDELVVTVAGHRRLLALPPVLKRCVVVDASLTHGRLVVEFVPDPDHWPQS